MKMTMMLRSTASALPAACREVFDVVHNLREDWDGLSQLGRESH